MSGESNKVQAYVSFSYSLLGRTGRSNMGVRKRDRVSPRLQFYASLPAEEEPEYKSGFDCDACGEGFAVGPFYHCTLTGVDQCMRCSVRSGLHPAPPPVVELFVRARPSAEATSELSSHTLLNLPIPAARPLLAFRTCDRDVGVLLSDGSCLFLEITSYAVNRGWLRSADGEVETIDEGADVATRFPWVEEWGNPLNLNDSHMFLGKRWGRLPSRKSVEWKHVVFVRRWDVSANISRASVSGGGCDVLSTTDATGNEYISVLDQSHQCYSLWWHSGQAKIAPAAVASPSSSSRKLAAPATTLAASSPNVKQQLLPEAWTLMQGRSPEPNHIMTFWEQSLMRGLHTIHSSGLFFVDSLSESAPSQP